MSKKNLKNKSFDKDDFKQKGQTNYCEECAREFKGIPDIIDGETLCPRCVREYENTIKEKF
jgi:hypothetical protein